MGVVDGKHGDGDGAGIGALLALGEVREEVGRSSCGEECRRVLVGAVGALWVTGSSVAGAAGVPSSTAALAALAVPRSAWSQLLG